MMSRDLTSWVNERLEADERLSDLTRAIGVCHAVGIWRASRMIFAVGVMGSAAVC